MENIFNKFISKLNLEKDSKSLFFLFKGEKINKYLTLNEIMNKNENKDSIKIVTFSFQDEDYKPSDIIVNPNYYDNNNSNKIDY